MENIIKILNTTTGRKMVSSLSVLKDMEKSNFCEFNWIDQLPLKQQELFDCIYQILDYSRIELALLLINKSPIFK